jgi:hypothetical protein
MGCACNHQDIKSEKINEMQDNSNNNPINESKTNAIQNNIYIIQDSTKKNIGFDDNNLKASTIIPNQIEFNENKTNEYVLKKETPTQNLNNENEQSLDNNKNLNNNLDEAPISASNNNQDNQDNQDNQEISTNRISESEFNELLIQYPLIEDDVIIEKRNPQENKIEKTIYYGEWDINKNVKHGRGIQIWPDGAKYIGYWKEGKASGKGKLYHADGDIYEGNWSDDKPNGYGIYTHADGTRYEGEWKNDKQNGKGKEFWPDGAIYDGQYIDGKKNGTGTFTWSLTEFVLCMG